MRNILIIKRKDLEAMANAEPQVAVEAEKVAEGDKNKKERRLRRAIFETISDWIPEQNKNHRREEIDAVRKFFGGEPLSGER